MALKQATGRVIFLRVQDIGTGFGPPDDQIDVEVVIRLDSQPAKAFGFQLREDRNRAVRQAMLDLLRDAFNNASKVTADFDIPDGKNNGVAIRIALSK